MYADPTGHGWFKKFWQSIVGVATTVLSIIAPPLAPAMWAINMAISAYTAIDTGNIAGFIGGMVGGAVFGAMGQSLAKSIAGTMGNFAHTFVGGAILGAVRGGITGFGAGFVGGLASGVGVEGSLKYGGIGAISGAAIGAVIGGISATQVRKAEYGGYKGPSENLEDLDVGKTIQDIETTKWAKTAEGQKVIKALKVSYSQKKINVTAGRYTRGRSAATIGDEIFINPRVKQQALPGILAHEGTHIVWYQEGKIYGLPEERAAYDAKYAVDTELYPEGAYNPTDEEIDRRYKGIHY